LSKQFGHPKAEQQKERSTVQWRPLKTQPQEIPTMKKCFRKCLIKNGFWALVAAGLVFLVISASLTIVVGAIAAGISLTAGMVTAINKCKAECKIN
jgi:hypothetical protein